MSICRKTGKEKHSAKAKAEAHLRSIQNVIDPDYGGEVYVCKYCKSWHVGRRPKNKYSK